MLQRRPRRLRALLASSAWQQPTVVRLLPALLLLGTGSYELSRNQPLWYDEAYSAIAARVPLGTLLAAVWHRHGLTSYLPTVPPSFNAPYYVLLNLWAHLAGTSATALRLPTLLCAAAAAGVAAELVRRLAGPGAGLLAGVLAATGPLLLDEAVQARDYGPALLAVLLSAVWLIDWQQTGRGLCRACLAAGAAGLLHWFTLPVLAGLAIWLLVTKRQRAMRAVLGLAAAALPALVLVAWSARGGAQGAPTPAAVGLSLSVHAILDWSGGFPELSLALLAAALLAVSRSTHRILVVCWTAIPLVLITGLELLRPTYFPRYLLFSLLGLVIGAALGVRALRTARLRGAAAIVLVGLSAAAVVPRLTDPAREPADAVVRLLAAEQRAGQPVIAADGRVALDLETYRDLDPRLQNDLVLPPASYPTTADAPVVWLVRVVVHQDSIPVLPAQQRLIDAGYHLGTTTTLSGTDVDLKLQQWTR